ncbi:MAG: NAD(P)H-hydrate dehydratase [Sphingomonadales bacterium]
MGADVTAMAQRFEHSDCTLLGCAEMARADALAMEGGRSGVELMLAAGKGVAREIMARWEARPVVVLCGPGNNGGDGFVIARVLAEAGWDVTVALPGSRKRLKGDAARMARLWTGVVQALGPEVLDGRSLVVDALFGAGLSRDLEGVAAAVVKAVNAAGLPVVAVDIPSGVHGDTGAVLGSAMKAALTVTFFRRKPGHLLMPGRLYGGDVVTVDIGIPASVLDKIGPGTWDNQPDLWLSGFPWPPLEGHKYSRGHAVVVSGPMAHTGAARLAARGALRAGAGLVSVASPPDAVMVNACQLTAIMTAGFDGAGELESMLSDRRKNAVLLGPGNGVNEATRANVLAVLRLGKACVLDADALSVFEDEPATLFEAIRAPCLLTPHEGEFARLFPHIARQGGKGPGALGPDAMGPDAMGKVEMAREAARTSGAVVLLKGPDTVIAAPDGRAAINGNAPAELATAGSGDVLAGFGLGLLAQGMEAFEAGCAAAWLHGAAAQAFGPGLVAEDLSEQLPAILRGLRDYGG